MRGFTRKPSTPWFDYDGNFGGIVHQERNITYVLFNRASHQVPIYQPASVSIADKLVCAVDSLCVLEAFFFLSEFVLGNNTLGTVVEKHGKVHVIGGENSSLAGNFLPGEHNPIFYGSGTTQFSTVWPSATIAAWNGFLATATETPPPML